MRRFLIRLVILIELIRVLFYLPIVQIRTEFETVTHLGTVGKLIFNYIVSFYSSYSYITSVLLIIFLLMYKDQ